MMGKKFEVRVIVTNRGCTFDLGMYHPQGNRYEPLGTHRTEDKERVVRGLRERIEREGHVVSFSETDGKR